MQLCVERVVEQGSPLDASALEVARFFHQRLPTGAPAALKEHFIAALSDLVDLVSALAPRLPPAMLAQFVQQASVTQVAEALERSLRNALRSEAMS